MANRFWHGLVTFGCGLTIPDEEEAIAKELMTPALIAAGITNDLFSYEKEYEDAMKAGHQDVVNAVWVLMGEHGISTEEAKLLCRKLIKEEIKKFVDTVEQVKVRTDLSADLRKYVEVMQYSLSGNVVWSLQCPRYHKTARYNDLQNLRAEHGVEAYPAQWPKLETRNEPASQDCQNTTLNGPDHGNETSDEVDLSPTQDHQHCSPTNGEEHVKGASNGIHSVPNGEENVNGDLNGVNSTSNGVSSSINSLPNAEEHIEDDSRGLKANGIEANGTYTNGDIVNNVHRNKVNGLENGVLDNQIARSPEAVPIKDMVALAIDKELPGLGDNVSCAMMIIHTLIGI